MRSSKRPATSPQIASCTPAWLWRLFCRSWPSARRAEVEVELSRSSRWQEEACAVKFLAGDDEVPLLGPFGALIHAQHAGQYSRASALSRLLECMGQLWPLCLARRLTQRHVMPCEYGEVCSLLHGPFERQVDIQHSVRYTFSKKTRAEITIIRSKPFGASQIKLKLPGTSAA